MKYTFELLFLPFEVAYSPGFTVFIEIRKKAKESKNASIPQAPHPTAETTQQGHHPSSSTETKKKKSHYRPLSDSTPAEKKTKHLTQQNECVSTHKKHMEESNHRFRLSSVEEARRAIIWSEVLRRKY